MKKFHKAALFFSEENKKSNGNIDKRILHIHLFFFNGDMSILPDLTGPNLKTGTESRP